LMGEAPGNADLQFRKNEYGAAFGLYQQQQWEQSDTRLLSLLSKFPDDKPAEALLRRVASLREDPPGASWDGVYIAKGK
jgi:hypothetical protein